MARFSLSDDCPCAYELFPVSRKLARRYEKESGSESVLFQSDWDYPRLASTLGWDMASAKCSHQSTDGTVTCRDCGKTADAFIQEARVWLDKHIGHHFNDPSGSIAAYFGW